MSDYINDSISVYVGCLASYNNGRHHGEWINLEECTLDDFYEKADEILENSPVPDAEEWEIFDTEGLPNHFKNKDIKKIYEIVEIKADCEHDVFDAVMNLVNEGTAHMDDLPSWIDSFVGFYDSETDFAEQIFNDCEECPDRLRPYIDIELYARDLFYNYEYCEKTGAVFARF
jgi:antirestriction protein